MSIDALVKTEETNIERVLTKYQDSMIIPAEEAQKRRNVITVSGNWLFQKQSFFLGLGTGYLCWLWRYNLGVWSSRGFSYVKAEYDLPDSDYISYTDGWLGGFLLALGTEIAAAVLVTTTYGLSGFGVYLGAKVMTNTVGKWYYKKKKE